MPRPSVKRGPPILKYKGRIFSIFEREMTFPDGSVKQYEYCERPNSVSVLAFDARGRLILIREWRAGYKQPAWFLPGGRVDTGDTPRTAAIRELQEEAGLKPKTIKLLYKKSPSNTLLWDIFVFAAKDVQVAPRVGDEEFPIEVVPTSLSHAVAMAKDGTIENEFISYAIIRFAEMKKRGEFRW